MLEGLVKAHMKGADLAVIDDYMLGLMNNEYARIIKIALMYKPAKALESPNYHTITATGMSA